jgi:hypothetical protein
MGKGETENGEIKKETVRKTAYEVYGRTSGDREKETGKGESL